jgi:hypothetical protein
MVLTPGVNSFQVYRDMSCISFFEWCHDISSNGYTTNDNLPNDMKGQPSDPHLGPVL